MFILDTDLFWSDSLICFGYLRSAPIEGRENREDENIGITRDHEHPKKHRSKRDESLPLLRTTTHVDEKPSIHITLGEHDLEISLEEHEHRAVLHCTKVGELLRMHVNEAIVPKDLSNEVPSLCDQVFYVISTTYEPMDSLNRTKPSLGFRGYRCLRIGIHGFDRPRHPVPETRCIKPIDLSGFLEGEIIQWMLAVLGLASKEILIVVHDLAGQNTGTCES